MRMMHAPTLRASRCGGIPEALILLRKSESNFGNEARGRSVFWAARYNVSGDHGVVVVIHRCGGARGEVCCMSWLCGHVGGKPLHMVFAIRGAAGPLPLFTLSTSGDWPCYLHIWGTPPENKVSPLVATVLNGRVLWAACGGRTAGRQRGSVVGGAWYRCTGSHTK